MNYGNIKDCDIANGNGVRVSLFVSGCTHHCKGCFNPETWDFEYGKPYTAETEEQIIKLVSKNYIRGLSLLGGEPMEPENQKALLPLLRKIKKELPEKDIWCYTGYTYKKDIPKTEITDEFLSLIDVLVDGEFMFEKKNISLRFRGSENQRVIDMNSSRKADDIILLI